MIHDKLFAQKLSLLLLLLYSFCVPTQAVAQGAGGVLPEALQFEPVDNTDIVNLATGNFVYTLPLIEVPGPEGGYPLALSYHAGIGINQEATWVGLGWSVNPGAVNRMVSGYPDDYKGDIVTTNYSGSAQYDTWGVNIGISYGVLGVNLHWDANTGAITGSVGLMVGIPLGKGFSVVGSINSSGTVGLGVGYKGAQLGVNVGRGAPVYTAGFSTERWAVGVSAGSESFQVRAGITDENKKQIGFSLATSRFGASFNINGIGFTTMSQAGEGNLSQYSYSIPIPLPIPFLSLGISKSGWSWYIYETYNDHAYGYMNQVGYVNDANPVTVKKFERQVQGSYLYSTQDIYQVNGQGIGGIMMPFSGIKYTLYDATDRTQRGQYQMPGGYTQNVDMRFLGDQGANLATNDPTDPTGTYDRQMFSGRRGGKKTDIIFSAANKLLGFVVTDVDGKIYEYKQQVWSGYQYNWSRNNNTPVVTTYLELKTPFAGNWLLTAVKGPDYVDRNSNGPDNNDWGYWVKFSYLTSIPQIWRIPYTGTAPGTSSTQTEMYADGARDIVYLDKIETATHTARFVKSQAKDRMMADSSYPVMKFENLTPVYKMNFYMGGNLYDQIQNRTSDYTRVYLRGYVWFRERANPDHLWQLIFWVNKSSTWNLSYVDGVTIAQTQFPATYTDSFGNLFDFDHVESAEVTLNSLMGQTTVLHINVSQKLDRVNIYNNNDLVNPIKSVRFTYDYSLCPSTPNSSSVAVTDGANAGKMTLKSVQVFGQNDVAAMPAYLFEYANGNAPGTGRNPAFHVDDWDMWGSYKDPQDRGRFNHRTPEQDAVEGYAKIRADQAAAWSLTKITNPLGGSLNIEYEADDYYNVGTTYDIDKTGLFFSQGNFGTTDRITYLRDGTTLGGFYYAQGTPYWTEVGNTAFFYVVCTDVNGQPPNRFFLIKRAIVNLQQIGAGPNYYIYLDSAVTFPRGNYSTATYLLQYQPEVFGGGIRVKSLTSSDVGVSYKTSYEYTTLDRGYEVSSGIATSLPWLYGNRDPLADHVSPSPVSETITEFYDYSRVFLDHGESYNRPAPSVVYSKVTVKNTDASGNSKNGQTVYEFYSPKDNPYQVSRVGQTLTINDNSGVFGKPKSITYYEKTPGGAYRKIHQDNIIEAFSSQLSSFGHAYYKGTQKDSALKPLGKVQERFTSSIQGSSAVTMTRNYENVFDVALSSTTYTYADPTTTTVSGTLTSEGKNFRWDAVSGAISASGMKDSKGMVQITGSTPAYWNYSTGNAEMEGKNMLTQIFQESMYRPASLDFTAVNTYQFPATDIVSSTVTTWSDQWSHDGVSPDGVWRLNDTYGYNAAHPYADFPVASHRYTSDTYPAVSPSFPWQMSSNISVYDRYSQPVQDARIDGNYSASLYSHGGSLPVAVATNAKLGEIGYNGLENGWETWETGGSSISTAQPRAGLSSAYCKTTNVTTNNVYGPTRNFYSAGGIDKNKSYILEAWAKVIAGKGKIAIETRNSSGAVLGTVSAQFTSGSWQYVSVKITPQQMSNLPADGYLRVRCGFPDSVGNEGYVDEVRFRPLDASMSTYTYDPITWRLTSITDQNSTTTYYEYDTAGRMALVRDQNKNILRRYAISYGRP